MALDPEYRITLEDYDITGAYSVSPDPLVWLVVPGSSQGEGQLYEDDGVSTDHRNGPIGSSGTSTLLTVAHAWTAARDAWSANVSAVVGSFEGYLSSRLHTFALKGQRPL